MLHAMVLYLAYCRESYVLQQFSRKLHVIQHKLSLLKQEQYNLLQHTNIIKENYTSSNSVLLEALAKSNKAITNAKSTLTTSLCTRTWTYLQQQNRHYTMTLIKSSRTHLKWFTFFCSVFLIIMLASAKGLGSNNSKLLLSKQ